MPPRVRPFPCNIRRFHSRAALARRAKSSYRCVNQNPKSLVTNAVLRLCEDVNPIAALLQIPF